MKNLLLLLLGFTLTFASCSKDSMETPTSREQQIPDLSVSGRWAVQLDAGLANTFGFEYYALDFGQNASRVNAYIFNASDSCATSSGYWNVTGRTSDSITLSGSGSNTVILTYVSSEILSINANIDGQQITGSIIVFNFPSC